METSVKKGTAKKRTVVKKEHSKVLCKNVASLERDRKQIWGAVAGLRKQISEVHDTVTTPIELKNGKTFHKTQPEAIKDSWERINHIQTKIEAIDNRTLVLDEINEMMNSYRLLKKRSAKFFMPFFRFTYKSAIFLFSLYIIITGLRFVVEGKISLYELITNYFMK